MIRNYKFDTWGEASAFLLGFNMFVKLLPKPQPEAYHSTVSASGYEVRVEDKCDGMITSAASIADLSKPPTF